MKLSVILATRDRAGLLLKTLQSLACQTSPANSYEIIVSDHGSSDDTAAICDQYRKTLPLRRILVPFKKYSILEPKNAAIRAARGELIVMLDCGVICPPTFLEEHLRAHSSEGARYVAGPCLGWNCEEETDYWKSLDPGSFSKPDFLSDCRFAMASQIKHAPWLLFWGCNFSAPRALLLESGLYDESFDGWGWEDLELGIRLEKLGAGFSFAPAAWTLHYPHPRRPLAERMIQGTANWIRTYGKHPMPALELWEASDFETWDRELDQILTSLAAGRAQIPRVSSFPNFQAYSRDGIPTLFYGAVADAPLPPHFQVTSPLPAESAPNLTYSLGLRTPFTDRQFKRVVISSYWRLFPASLSPARQTPASLILKEAQRVAQDPIILYNQPALC